MTDVVEKIHKAFKESFEKSEVVFDHMLTKLERQLGVAQGLFAETVVYKELKSLFPQSVEVKKAEEGEREIAGIKHSKSEIDVFLRELSQIRMMFSTYRIITYSQMIDILEEYNLFVGPSVMYVGDIPSKNAQEITQFSKYLTKDRVGGIHSLSLAASSIDLVSNEMPNPIGFTDPEIPLFTKGFARKSTGSRGLYIVGQHKHWLRLGLLTLNWVINLSCSL